MIKKGQIGIYIHWPFCLSKCPYCDFNSHVRDSIDDAAWQDAYLKTLDHYAELTAGQHVRSVFFGGGTPSLMKPAVVAAILDRIQKNWRIANDIEITLEANPTSVEAEKFKAFRAAGINRVSLGVQALNDADLKFLGRQHSAEEALAAIKIAQDNFERYSFDLIYARPEQTLAQWEVELRQAVKYARGHLSLYQLTIERNTPFYMSYARGDFSMPQEEFAADFYILTQEILESEGLPAYEVSNHAAPGHESRHNMIYWQYGDYIGAGPGAHGRLTIDGVKHATREHSAPEIWLERAGKNGQGAHPYESLGAHDRFMEALMMGFRLREGVSKAALEAEGQCALYEKIDPARLKELAAQGWLVDEGDVLRLEAEGLLRLNAILPYILKEDAVKSAA